MKGLYINKLWFMLMGSVVVLLCVSFFAQWLFTPALAILFFILLLTITDHALLFWGKGSIIVVRNMAPRFSLGDDNTITLEITNTFRFKVKGNIIDEIPVQFQKRDFLLPFTAGYSSYTNINYTLRPTSRGEYSFGNVIVFAQSPISLLQRRFTASTPETIKVYPSFLQLKKYHLLATSDNLFTGIKKIRRLGHSLEFEKIKDYVPGDDIRTINWKATARNSALMVNTYTDARQQQVYCIIDKGRNMKMPFDGMTLLDHSINASLVLLNVALLRQDKAGLITFADKVNDIVAAERRAHQLNILLETLYKQQTEFKESDMESLWSNVHRSISQRSLILLFTNYETHSSLERQLPFLKRIAGRHLLCVVFFQNTLLKNIYESEPDDLEGIYIKTIADQFDLEKKQIVKELRMHGILSILTTPQSLSVDVVNKYLELKAKQMV